MDSDTMNQEPEVLEKPKRGVEEVSYGSPLPTGTRKSKETPRKRSGCHCLLYVLLGCLGGCCLCCVLPVCGTAVFGGAVVAMFDHNKVTLTETQTANVPQDEVITLDVSNKMGDITIQHGSQEDEVIVKAVKTGYGLTKGSAQDRLDTLNVNLTQPDDTTVKIEVQNAKKSGGIQFSTSSVKLTISVPERVNLVVDAETGTLTISGLQVQSLNLNSTLGMIDFTGPLPSDASALLEVRTTTGEVQMHLPRATHVQINAETSVGEITVSNRFAQVNKTSGNITDSVGNTWIGTLGTGSGTPPVLKLRTGLGAIVVDVD